MDDATAQHYAHAVYNSAEDSSLKAALEEDDIVVYWASGEFDVYKEDKLKVTRSGVFTAGAYGRDRGVFYPWHRVSHIYNYRTDMISFLE